MCCLLGELSLSELKYKSPLSALQALFNNKIALHHAGPVVADAAIVFKSAFLASDKFHSGRGPCVHPFCGSVELVNSPVVEAACACELYPDSVALLHAELRAFLAVHEEPEALPSKLEHFFIRFF